MREVRVKQLDKQVVDAWVQMQYAMRVAGIHLCSAITPVFGDYMGDGINGYLVFDDGTTLFPAAVGEHIGWGVSWGDETEGSVTDILTASYETQGITGKHTHHRPLRHAIAAAIESVVKNRLFKWDESCREHEYAEEINNAKAQ